MATTFKIKFNPKRGGSQDYDILTPAFRITNWTSPAFSVYDSPDDSAYTLLDENTDWRADIDWASGILHLHILKNYSSITYLSISTAHVRTISTGYQIEGPRVKNIPQAFILEGAQKSSVPVSWHTGSVKVRNISAAAIIQGESGLNIAVAFYEKDIRRRNIPLAYGISGAIGTLISVAYKIGNLDSRLIPAGYWCMGLAHLPAKTVILPEGSDPGASRVKGNTTELTLSGSNWEDLD